MKFTIPSKKLLTYLSALSKVVNTKNPIAILENFLFTLKNGILVVTATDNENTIKARIELLDAEGNGSFTINVKMILDLLKELPDQGLTFEIDESNYEIHLSFLTGDYKFVGINGNEYPQKEETHEEKMQFTMPAKEITKSLSQTVFAVGTDPIRPILTGILWDIQPGEITFVSSDTHTLVRYENKHIAPGFSGSFILPSKPANILTGILTKEDENVTVSFDSKSVTFETDCYTLSSQFIHGKYPNYNAAIPKNNPLEVIVDRALLLNAIKRVSIFATYGGLIRLKLTENKISILAKEVTNMMSAEEFVTCEYSGDEFEIGFQKDNIIKMLNNIGVDNILIKMSESSRAGLFMPSEQAENEDLLILLMPMSL